MKKIIFFLFIGFFAAHAQNSNVTGQQGDAEKAALSPDSANHTKSTDSKPTNNPIFVDFVGSGDIQKSLASGEKINANTGLGIVLERNYSKGSTSKNAIQSFDIEAVINIASTADTIQAEIKEDVLQNRVKFGSYILNPVSANQSLYLNSNIYFGNYDTYKWAKWISGVNFRMISSNSTWKYEEQTSNLGAIAVRLGVFHEFFPDNYRINKDGRSRYSLFAGINYSYRGIWGDIVSEKNLDLRKYILGSKETNFHGIEFNFGFRLNNIRAEFQMPIFNKVESIEGLTDTQFLFSIKFIGGFSLKLDNQPEIDASDAQEAAKK